MEWVEISTEEMQRARQARGLSYERIARAFPFSGKTIERWVKRGAVPRRHVEKFAEELGLQIDIPERPTTISASPTVPVPIAVVEVLLADFEAQRGVGPGPLRSLADAYRVAGEANFDLAERLERAAERLLARRAL